MEIQRLYQLPQVPELSFVVHRSLQRIELLLGGSFAPSIGLDLLRVVEGRRGVEQDKVACALGVAQGVHQGDKPSERVAQDGDLLEAQVLAQGVGISTKLFEGECLPRWSARATVTAVVVVDEVHHVAQRV